MAGGVVITPNTQWTPVNSGKTNWSDGSDFVNSDVGKALTYVSTAMKYRCGKADKSCGKKVGYAAGSCCYKVENVGRVADLSNADGPTRSVLDRINRLLPVTNKDTRY